MRFGKDFRKLSWNIAALQTEGHKNLPAELNIEDLRSGRVPALASSAEKVVGSKHPRTACFEVASKKAQSVIPFTDGCLWRRANGAFMSIKAKHWSFGWLKRKLCLSRYFLHDHFK